MLGNVDRVLFLQKLDEVKQRVDTVQELAQLVGCSRASIFTWSRAHNPAGPSLKYFIRLAAVNAKLKDVSIEEEMHEWLRFSGLCPMDEVCESQIVEEALAYTKQLSLGKNLEEVELRLSADELRRLARLADVNGPMPLRFIFALLREMRNGA